LLLFQKEAYALQAVVDEEADTEAEAEKRSSGL
jgi:hypothetical protein